MDLFGLVWSAELNNQFLIPPWIKSKSSLLNEKVIRALSIQISLLKQTWNLFPVTVVEFAHALVTLDRCSSNLLLGTEAKYRSDIFLLFKTLSTY